MMKRQILFATTKVINFTGYIHDAWAVEERQKYFKLELPKKSLINRISALKFNVRTKIVPASYFERESWMRKQSKIARSRFIRKEPAINGGLNPLTS